MFAAFQSSMATGFNPVSAFATAFFGGVFALVTIVLKQKYDFRSEKLRYIAVLKAESIDVGVHFGRNTLRLAAMISALRDTQDLLPERLHIEKLKWPQDTSFFNKEMTKFFSVRTANNIAKFRLRLRNANIDVDAALRVYDSGEVKSLKAVLEYIRGRSARLERLAANALTDDRDILAELPPIDRDFYRTVDDMIFLPIRGDNAKTGGS